MTSENLEWSVLSPLSPGQVTLLEASAGTGKTWQVASLVLRLVAEGGVPITRILTITFTRAAAAELRARIRRRLEAARHSFEHGPGDDPVLRHLLDDPSARTARRLAVEAALASFDEAPISTIHSFVKQMLTQFAFESGQEAGLELVEDEAALLDERVEDALAKSFAHLDAPTLGLLQELGWKRDGLRDLAKRMAGAVAPQVLPDLALDLARSELTAALGPLPAEAERLRAMWVACGDDLVAAASQKGLLKGWQARWGPSRVKRVLDYLSGAAFVGDLDASGLEPQKVLSDWQASEEALRARAFWPAVEALEAFRARVQPIVRALRPQLAFVRNVRAEVRAELAKRRRLTQDAMLGLLAERIAATGPDGPLARAIRGRYDVALVDEFQDTDGAQWAVIKSVFAHRPGAATDDGRNGDWAAYQAVQGQSHGTDTVLPEAGGHGPCGLRERADGRRLLYLIGDPKQAIYAFRGGDVHVYLEAAGEVDARRTMTTNYRSDAPVITAMNALWQAAPGAFGHPDVHYIAVDADKGNRIEDPRSGPALDLRWFDQATVDRQLAAQMGRLPDADAGTTSAAIRNADDATACAARLAALEALRLLRTGVKLHEPDGPRALGPGDMAVLVSKHEEGRLMKRELERLGLPAVRTGSSDVFASEAAGWILAWLRAVAGGGRDAWARVAATTPLFGWTAPELAAALEAEAGESDVVERWSAFCAGLAATSSDLPRLGVVRAFEQTSAAGGTGAARAGDGGRDVMTRLLAGLDGERHATDVRHLLELLHRHALTSTAGVAGASELAAWLASERPARGASASVDVDSGRTQRLESDARAITIVTIHGSKGLEYPVVLLPFLGRSDSQPAGYKPLVWHDDAGAAVLDLRHPDDPERADGKTRADAEQVQETARLLYVALTRARHRTVAWLTAAGPSANLERVPLGRLLVASEVTSPSGAPARAVPGATASAKGSGRSVEKAPAGPADKERFLAWVARLKERAGDAIGGSVAPGDEPEPAPWRGEDPAGPATAHLRARPWRGRATFPNTRPRVSFTSLVAALGEAPPDEPPDPSDDQDLMGLDGAAALGPVGAGGAGAARPDSARTEASAFEVSTGSDGPPQAGPLDGLSGGKEVGVWVHGVFEALDFGTCTGLAGEPLEAVLEAAAQRAGLTPDRAQRAVLAAGLPSVLAAPLGGPGLLPGSIPSTFRLADLRRADRLDELAFNLRVPDGGPAAAIRGALSERAGETWPGAAWISEVVGPRDFELPANGAVLNGAIDLVFRVGGRYFIADYKTNFLRATERGVSGLAATAPPAPTVAEAAYGPASLAEAMSGSHYHLQSLLYSLALHRLLRQRLGRAYDYDRHVGGHLYLFLRGMGPDAGDQGVFRDRWPRAVVERLDAALTAGGTRHV